ncbi:MAG: hypothetical protein J6T45_01215 [Fibrobacterales bacterium]|nr:hypothetical protein [Fibrobacterales bacterium]
MGLPRKLLLLTLLALSGAGFASDGIKRVRASADSMVFEVEALSLGVSGGANGAAFSCANCDRDVDGSLWISVPLELKGPGRPKISVKVLERRNLERGAAERWADQRDTAALAMGAAAAKFVPRATNPVRSGSGWIAAFRVPVAAAPQPGSRAAAVQATARARVELSFPGARGAGTAASSPAAAPLRALPAPPEEAERTFSFGREEPLVRVRVGDDDLSTFDEDGLYVLTFERFRSALSSAGRSATADGIPVGRLALFSGLADTIPRIAAGAPSAGNLAQIPCEVRDHGGAGGAGDGLFGPGDSLLFFAHGASGWVPSGTDSDGRTYWKFYASKWGKTQDYWVALLESGEALRLKTEKRSGGTALPSAPRYVRAEKDLSAQWGYGSSADDSTGADWFWFRTEVQASRALSSADLAHPSLAKLSGIGSSGEVLAALDFYSYYDFAGSIYPDPVFDLKAGSASASPLGRKDGESLVRLSGVSGTNPAWSLEFESTADWPLRFNGMSLRWESPVAEDWRGRRIFHDRGNGLWKRTLSGADGCRVLKIVDGNAEAALPLASGSWSDSVSSEGTSYWVDCPADRRTAKEVEAWRPPSSAWTMADPVSGTNAAGERLKPEMAIVAPAAFESEAADYARFRSEESLKKVRCAVVRAEDLYALHDGGRASPVALRDWLRKAKEDMPSLKSVLLLGDAHFDYLGNSGIEPMLLPSFEHQFLLTDDYFGALDAGESVSAADYTLELAVGRVPARDVSDLRAYFAKAKTVERASGGDLSEWRNRNLFVADDFNKPSSADLMGHTASVESAAELADSLFPVAENRRLLMADWPFDGVNSKKGAADAFVRELNAGRWLTVYFGHGGMHQIADEKLFDVAAVPRLTNASKPTLLAAFSCHLGLFDRPKHRALGEELLFAPNGGVSAVVAATRETYPSDNEALAKKFLAALAEKSGTTMGEALRRAKNALFSDSWIRSVNTHKYALLGDPSLSQLPWKATVSFTRRPDTLKALDRIEIAGTVEGISSGDVLVQLEEQPRVRTEADTVFGEDVSWTVREQGNVLLGSHEKIRGGKFSATFVAPRKLSFGDTNSVLRAYVWSGGERIRGGSVVGGIPVRGTSAWADSIDDSEPPTVRARLCDQAAAGWLGPEAELQLPACLEFEVTDATGVDQSALPDEGVTLELVGMEKIHHPLFTEQSGTRVLFRKLIPEERPDGRIVARVRAQDVVGNVVEKEWKIRAGEKLEDGLFDVHNAPNPMKNRTTFRFKLGSTSPAEVSIRIYSTSGKLLRVIRRAVSGVTTWDGRDAWGNKLANGLYYYQVNAKFRTTDAFTGKTKTKSFSRLQKLVISR